MTVLLGFGSARVCSSSTSSDNPPHLGQGSRNFRLAGASVRRCNHVHLPSAQITEFRSSGHIVDGKKYDTLLAKWLAAESGLWRPGIASLKLNPSSRTNTRVSPGKAHTVQRTPPPVGRGFMRTNNGRIWFRSKGFCSSHSLCNAKHPRPLCHHAHSEGAVSQTPGKQTQFMASCYLLTIIENVFY